MCITFEVMQLTLDREWTMHSHQLDVLSTRTAAPASGRDWLRLRHVAMSPTAAIAVGAALLAAGLALVAGSSMLVGVAAALSVLGGVILASVLI